MKNSWSVLSWKVLNVVINGKRGLTLHRMGTLELHFLQLHIEHSQLKFPTPQFPNYTFELPVKFLRITLSPFVFRKTIQNHTLTTILNFEVYDRS